ncbi:MAG: hypothetical protein ACYTBY_03495 [Planctomycetota bacterium]|jgi:hypothetical protein
MNISVNFLKPVTSTLKKYASLVPSVVITLVALLLFPLVMKVGSTVKEKMKESAQKASTIQSLSREVPSKDEPKQIETHMDNFQKELDEIQTLARQGSQRELIRYNIFPEPKDTSSQVYTQYGKEYRRRVEGLIEGVNASDAPSDAEIRAKTGSSRGRTTAVNPLMGGYAPSRRKTALEDDPMVDALCLTRSQEISVYANPSDFTWYDFWQKYDFSGQDQGLEDCWNSQVAYWIFEDVVNTVKKVNGQTDNVLSAPVKRILGVSFNGPVMVGVGSGTRSSSEKKEADRDAPNYVTASLPSKFMASSPTGREGNEDVDVVHFAVSVLVENQHVLAFMKELCSEKPHTFREDFKSDGQEKESRHNQITVLQSDLRIIEKKSEEHGLYRYGDKPVVWVDLVCEYLFNRAGYDSIKPNPIKERLEQASDTAASDSKKKKKSGGFNPMMF